MYRRRGGEVEVFLVHPGGPFAAGKDQGIWSIPKGEHGPGEDPLEAAKREFREETGLQPDEEFRGLGEVRQSGFKTVRAWAFEGDCDPAGNRSNTFEMEWPPHSGRKGTFPEVDRAAWFPLAEAKRRIVRGQVPLLEALERLLASPPDGLP